MGGSLAADCRKKFPRAKITGVSRSKKALRDAQKKKWIHRGFTTIEKAIPDADLVVLCTPVQTIAAYLKKIDANASRPVYVTDVGSVKGSIERESKALRLKQVVFLGAHPMVGSHLKGIDAAQPNLYHNGLIFVIKKPKAAKKYQPIKSFWKKFSKHVVEVSAAEHDKIVAEISHLPHILASCLAQSISKKSLSFASSGFKDTTRVAAGHESIWLPIVAKNRQEILKTIKSYQKYLTAFRWYVQSGNEAQMNRFLRNGRLKREQI